MPEPIPTNRSALEHPEQVPETPEQRVAKIAATPFNRLGPEGQQFLMFAGLEDLRAVAIAASEQGNPSLVAATGGAAMVRLAAVKSENSHDEALRFQELVFDAQKLSAQAQSPGQQG